ncbi:peptide ABC transporter permease [Methylophaga sp. 41_12_T18]|nr:peptide ABC transporter permease [Methylophaga sp. 41_12_T18]
MPFLPVLLWTDILIYLLLAVITAGIFYIRQRPYMRAPWRHVFQRKRGVISVIILVCYITIGLLDSIHFRQALSQDDGQMDSQQHYSTEVLTVLDLMLLPLRNNVEKSYSAPFAIHAFTREMQSTDAGDVSYDYSPLIYAGQHLDKEQHKTADIAKTVSNSSAMAIVLWLILLLAYSLFVAVRSQANWLNSLKNIQLNTADYPLKTIILMLLAVLLIGFNLLSLSMDYHILGTDKVGQDVFYQTLKSIRTGLVIGTLTTLVMLPFALFMGIAAGYFKGWVDDVIQYIYTTLNSIPGVLLIAAAVLMLQVYMNNHPENFVTIAERADMRLLFLCIILGMTSWTGLCRVLRGETLKLREADFVQAARALGAGPFAILRRHILPNLMHIVMIAVVLDFSGLVLAEAVLSYVGVGVDPSMNSWGNMINSARLEMAREPVVWWSLTAAFVSMFTLVLAANLFADVVRDAFDPRAQTS